MAEETNYNRPDGKQATFGTVFIRTIFVNINVLNQWNTEALCISWLSLNVLFLVVF